MSKTVFILGAGASKGAGAPLMREFLDVAESLHDSGKVKESAEEFDLVRRGLSDLQAAQSKFSLPLTSDMESAFAGFEMAGICSKLGDMNPQEVERLPLAMKRVIAATLEESIQFPYTQGEIRPPTPYSEFVELLEYIEPGAPWGRSAVITLNYDISVDFALHRENIRADYCLSSGAPGAALRLLKLHGSVNWGFCSECHKVWPRWFDDYFKVQRRWQPPHVRLRVGSEMVGFKGSCGHTCDAEPFLVPPTWNKMVHSSELRHVWAGAARELQEASEIIVIGYSLPETDSFFKYLLAIGTLGRTRIIKFWVFDPDKAVERRFKLIIGPAAVKRFAYYAMTFQQAVGYLREELRPSPRPG